MGAVPPPIRVLTLIDLIGPIGGAERLAVQLAGGLDRDRFEPWVCVSRFDPEDPSEPGMAEAARQLEGRGVRVIGLGRRRTADVAPWRRLVSVLRRERIDVLHAHKFGSNLWGTLVGTAARTPVIVAHEHSWSFEGEPVRRLIDRHVVARGADAVIAVSREDRRRMVEIVGMAADKVRFVPNGAPELPPPAGRDVRGELGIPAGAPVVGTVGMLRREKAFEVLVAAAAELRAAHPGLVVLIAGYGPDRARLEAEIAERGMGETVRLLGHRDDVADLVRAFDVGVLCSDREGMPVSVLEYMEAARPVVATRVGGVGDIVVDGEHGLLVPPRDPPALARAVDELLRDPARRAAMGERGRARRRAEFGLDVMVERVQELYVELLGLRNGAPAPNL